MLARRKVSVSSCSQGAPLNLVETLRAPLAEAGLNHLGVVGKARYDAAAPPALRTDRLHPATRSIVVIGSGGREHWNRFLAWLEADPAGRLAARDHPLDDFAAATLASLQPLLVGCRVFFPALDAPVSLNFTRLAALAGLGAPSELGILVSERFGPWFGLRAAIFAPFELEEGQPAGSSCDGCPAPCRSACPVAIVGPHKFPWRSCKAAREAPGSPCRARCGAREACVVAPQERYDTLEMTYHYDRVSGRRALCARFGVADEREGRS